MKNPTLIFAVVLLGSLVTLNATDARKINILHIHADDHRADGLHALGYDQKFRPL